MAEKRSDRFVSMQELLNAILEEQVKEIPMENKFRIGG